jgi:cytohesin
MRRLYSGFLLAASCCAATAPATDSRLIDALKRRDVKAFNTLMAQHADINAALPDGSTALSWAVFFDLKEPAGKLIAAGANVNSASEYGETPLTLALANGDVALVEDLLKAGADPKAKRWNGETTLMIAAGVGSLPEVKLLLERGVDVNATDAHKGQNALMWAAAEAHGDVIDFLISKGANVNAASRSGSTPLAFATGRNDAKSVQRLLAAGADANYALPDGTKMLMLAATSKATDVAALLLDKGADPNIADRAGNTPLHIAAQNGSLEMAKSLLAKGAKVDAKTNAAASSAVPGAPGFVRGGSTGQMTPLFLAAKNNRVDLMKALLAAGADPKVKSQDGTTLLLAAASSGHKEAAEYAFEFDKDVKAVDENGDTAMHKAVSGGAPATQDNMVDLVQYLADIGVPMDEFDKRGRTPIKAGDGIPLDKPIQRMADIIVSRGGTPHVFPKEYVKPKSAPAATATQP